MAPLQRGSHVALLLLSREAAGAGGRRIFSRLPALTGSSLTSRIGNGQQPSSVRYSSAPALLCHESPPPPSPITAIPPSISRQHPAVGEVFKTTGESGGLTFQFETGQLARFATGAVVVSVSNTSVLATAVSSYRDDGGKGFLPMQVDYREKQYAAARIPSTFMRREMGVNEREILGSRVIDRSIRPLFPKGYMAETQISANVMCSDGDFDPDVMAINAASAALTVSHIPWDGPIGAVRVGRVEGVLVVNPSMEQLRKSDLKLTYACTKDKTVMIETQAAEISNEELTAALQLAHAEAVKLIEPQLQLAAQVQQAKRQVSSPLPSAQLVERVRHLALAPMTAVLGNSDYGKIVRDAVFGRGVRVDGRDLVSVRKVFCRSGFMPALYGSALFSRGNTQVLCTVTVGPAEDAQRLESLVGPVSKRFMVHYSFPGYSIGEVKPERGGLNRREVGHGTLAEKALLAVLPLQDFPYCIRLTSETLMSDGSSSMATVCGGSLALMDAGIALKRHVAGVSIGLITDVDPATSEIRSYRLLTDILGLEDYLGDMDFKIAGSRLGITAIQLDVKLPGVPLHILCEALAPAQHARCHILDCMEADIAEPRKEKRDDAPRFGTLRIPPDTIGSLIGPQGSTIKPLQQSTGTRITVDDSGLVSVFARDLDTLERAKQQVLEAVGGDIEVGGRYEGTVVAIKDFGAFVQVGKGTAQGLLHISEIDHVRVSRVDSVLSVGQKVDVVCIARDVKGNLKLSRRALLPPPPPPSDLPWPPRRGEGGWGPISSIDPEGSSPPHSPPPTSPTSSTSSSSSSSSFASPSSSCTTTSSNRPPSPPSQGSSLPKSRPSEGGGLEDWAESESDSGGGRRSSMATRPKARYEKGRGAELRSGSWHPVRVVELRNFGAVVEVEGEGGKGGGTTGLLWYDEVSIGWGGRAGG